MSTDNKKQKIRPRKNKLIKFRINNVTDYPIKLKDANNNDVIVKYVKTPFDAKMYKLTQKYIKAIANPKLWSISKIKDIKKLKN